jgi:hypothetical protein
VCSKQEDLASCFPALSLFSSSFDILVIALAQVQHVDLFGEIAGIAFSPHADTFFVGIADVTYSSLLEFERHH